MTNGSVVALCAALCLLLATERSLAAESDALFENVVAQVGLEGEKGGRVSFAELNGDGVPDLILGCSRVFLSRPGVDGAGRRFERSSAVLVADGARGVQSVQVGDVNNDGNADLFLGRMTDLSNEKFEDDGLRNEIWLGDGAGGFKRKKGSGLGDVADTTVSACFVDVNEDGALDLFVANAYVAYGKSLEAFPDRLYLGKGSGVFQETTADAGLLLEASPGGDRSRRPSYGVAHTDWNNDGRQDLLTMSYGRQWNRLWSAQKKRATFVDVGALTGFDGDAERSGEYPKGIGRSKEAPFRSNGNTFDCAVADFDGDGDMDCFLASIAHAWAGPSSDPSMLLVNQGAAEDFAFERRPSAIPRSHEGPNWNQGDMHAGWLDVDNDGRLDLAIASSDYPDQQLLRVFHQESDHSFIEWTDRLGVRWINASQISFADFDRDGATDILVGTNNRRLTKEQREGRTLEVGLLRNLCAARAGNSFFSLRLAGKGRGGASRDAIGARVTIWIGDSQQTREVYGGLGHGGHRDDTEVRFGVGKAETIDRVEIRWPDKSGSTQRFLGVEAGRFYSLSQGRELVLLEAF